MKQLLTGIDIGFMLAAFSFGISVFAQNTVVKPVPVPVHSQNQRYVIYQHPEFRGDQFLLDSQSGKVWRLVSRKNSNGELWEVMDHEDN